MNQFDLPVDCDGNGTQWRVGWLVAGASLYINGFTPAQIKTVATASPLTFTYDGCNTVITGFVAAPTSPRAGFQPYRFHCRKQPPGVVDNEQLSIALNVVATQAEVPVAIVGPTDTAATVAAKSAPDLVHALSDGVQVGIWLANGLVSTTSPPVILLPAQAASQIQRAARDPSFVAAVASLTGKDADAVIAAMDGTIIPAWTAAMYANRLNPLDPLSEYEVDGKWTTP